MTYVLFNPLADNKQGESNAQKLKELLVGKNPEFKDITKNDYPDFIKGLSEADEVKVVYTHQDVEKYRRLISAPRYFLQPCSILKNGKYMDNREEVIRYCLEHPWWQLSLQIHKILNIQ